MAAPIGGDVVRGNSRLQLYAIALGLLALTGTVVVQVMYLAGLLVLWGLCHGHTDPDTSSAPSVESLPGETR